MSKPAAYYENNVGGTLSVLRAAVEEGVRHFIFSSTAATFGNPVETPITESHPQRPINAYGETKLAIERALPHYERAYGLRSIILRYFNAAGAIPTASSARITRRRSTSFRARLTRRSAAASLPSTDWTTTPRTGRACATTST